MCKESIVASTCPRCGRRMYYAEQHLLVCNAPLRPQPTHRPRKKKEAASVA